ncbi:MAG: diguanylate cyclase, partial [Candidatus Omnitrophota bacterium]|nr:diguanylate cyclase [Candidatus Omnitrophota bacterium]
MKFLIYFMISIGVLLLSYRASLRKAYVVTFAATIFILVSQRMTLVYETWVALLYINILPIITRLFKKDYDRHREKIRTKFDEVKKVYEDLIHQDKHEVESNLEREKKLHQVLNLYEVSKDMSTCLTISDIFSVFSAPLKRLFRFKFSKLVLLEEGSEADPDITYEIEFGQRVSTGSPDDFDKEVVSIALEAKKIISISRKDKTMFLRRLSMIRDFDTFVSLPLFVEERLVGVLYIENLPGLYFENFIILAKQFIMQFQRVYLYKKVQEMSITDSLTNLSTRRYFLERFEEELRRSMRHKSNLSFLMLDLDHFKDKNDRLGHLVGDVVLKEAASILKSSLREIDIIGRYGGEEFAIVLTATDRDGACQVAERIRRQ